MPPLHECYYCRQLEERVMMDTWTGREVCLSCLTPVIHQITHSPASDGGGDNIDDLITKEV